MSDATKKCPFCGEEILAMAIKCKHCQSALGGMQGKNISAETGKTSDISGGIQKKVSPLAPFRAAADDTVTGKDILKGIGGTILAVITVFFCGWLYVWSCSIPFVFWMMPFIYGGIAGGIMFLGMKNFRTDDLGVFILFGILAVVVACYANWVWFVSDLKDVFIMDPGNLWERIQAIHRVRTINFSVVGKTGSIPIRDGMLMLAWLLELAMISGGVAVGFYAANEQAFFCPNCRRWNDINSKPYKLASDKPEYELTSIEAIMQMTTPVDENSDHYTVTTFECLYCRHGTFSLSAQKAVLNSGKYEFREKKLLNHIPCPEDKLKELNKFITETGIPGKK